MNWTYLNQIEFNWAEINAFKWIKKSNQLDWVSWIGLNLIELNWIESNWMYLKLIGINWTVLNLNELG